MRAHWSNTRVSSVSGVWWVPHSGCPVFLSIQASSLVAPTSTSQCFLNCPSTGWHILSSFHGNFQLTQKTGQNWHFY
jgi:hypothetical protein